MSYKLTICILVLFLGVLAFSTEDVGSMLIEHVSDGNTWQPFPFMKAISLSNLSFLGKEIRFTRHVLMLLISSGILVLLLSMAFAKVRIIPNTLGGILEPVVLFIRDSIVFPTMGEARGNAWLPFFLTMFFFILASNILGLIPMFPTVTSNMNVTIALAVITLSCIFCYGVISLGPIGFFTNMIPHGIPKPIGILLLGIETLGLFIRSGVLAVRLFANMMAGHFVILSLIVLIFVVHPLAAVISIPLALFINLLEVLVCLIQALVFTLLSALFISSASSNH